MKNAMLAAMPEGIGELTFASPQWTEAAGAFLAAEVDRRAAGLSDLGAFTLCEVGHNPPAYLKCGNRLAWHAKFDGASVEVGSGELPDAQCTLKIEADHSILSNLGRIQHHGRDPEVVAAATDRLSKLTRWKFSGKPPEHPVLVAVLSALHEAMAPRTLPRFVFMTPEWVSTARHILSTRVKLDKYASELRDVQYTFSEEFTDTPRYAFPDGRSGGFWVRLDRGAIEVGAGPLPEALQPADYFTFGTYSAIIPVGRTVNAAMTDDDKQAQAKYSEAAFRFDKQAGRRPVEQSSPSGHGEMPKALARVFLPLHDELGKRTSGELPSDFVDGIKPEWATAQPFDRDPGYERSWVRYDRVDIFGNELG